MIVVSLGGGIGNQLFQYAAARALALRLGVALGLDRRLFAGRSWPRYGLDVFAVENKPVDPAILPPVSKGIAGRLRHWFGPRSTLTVFEERSFTFDPAVLALPDGTYLKGYFQSERYFADQAPALRRDLAFRDLPDAANRAALEEIATSAAVSLHVRRGDYVSNPSANRFHGVVGVDYYRRAVRHVADRCAGAPRFYVFTDDPDWVAAEFDIGLPFRLIRHNLAANDGEDLRLMAACRHHILANSSFSWWGAWLNPSPDKIVVAPRRWFQDPSVDESTLIPAQWVRL